MPRPVASTPRQLTSRGTVCAVAFASLTAASAAAAPMPKAPPAVRACVAPTVHLTPTVPVAGTIFRITRPRANANSWSATLAGESLAFRAVGDSLVAIGAAPIDSVHGISIVWHCRASDGEAGTDTTRVITDAGNYRLEQLRVAPRFSAAPNAALSARMARESAKAAAVSRASHDTPSLVSGEFRAPRTSRITSDFGSGRTFNGTVTSRHMGTDFAGATGAPVLAANRGVVRLVDRFYLGGNVVYIDHGLGLVTAYLHLSKTRVAVGDTVARGQRIGDVGATGRVTGPHLHLIARFGQITINPMSLMGWTP